MIRQSNQAPQKEREGYWPHCINVQITRCQVDPFFLFAFLVHIIFHSQHGLCPFPCIFPTPQHLLHKDVLITPPPTHTHTHTHIFIQLRMMSASLQERSQSKLESTTFTSKHFFSWQLVIIPSALLFGWLVVDTNLQWLPSAIFNPVSFNFIPHPTITGLQLQQWISSEASGPSCPTPRVSHLKHYLPLRPIVSVILFEASASVL